MGDDEQDTSHSEKPCSVSRGIERNVDTIELDSDEDVEIGGEETDWELLGGAEALNVPAEVKEWTVGEVPMEIQKELVLKLDLPAIGPLKNWQNLADHLGMPNKQISWMEEKIRYPKSPTQELLRMYKEKNFGEVLKHIEEDMERKDVIIEVTDAYNRLKEKKPLLAGQDSGLQSQDWSDCKAAARPSPCLSAAQDSLHPSPVLITYFPETEPSVRKRQRKYLSWLRKNLKPAGCPIILLDDILRQPDASLNVTHSLAKCFNQARKVVVVLSEAYCECLQNEESVGGTGEPVRFLQTLIESEFYHSKCLNFRFHPIVFAEDGGCSVPGLHHLPLCFRNTLIFRWPLDHDKFLKVLLDTPSTFSLISAAPSTNSISSVLP